MKNLDFQRVIDIIGKSQKDLASELGVSAGAITNAKAGLMAIPQAWIEA